MDLSGRRIVTTRRENDEAGLRAALEKRGAQVISVPSIRIVPVEADYPDRRRLDDPTLYTHVVLTSANAVEQFVAAVVAATGRATVETSSGETDLPERWRHVRLACVGPRTADALERVGWPVHFTGRGGNALALARELLEEEKLGPEHHVLLPQSEIARGELSETLAAAGVQTTSAVLYRTEGEDREKARPLDALYERGERPDAVVFFSPSAVRGFLAIIPPRLRRSLDEGLVRIVTIGPTTSGAVRREGLEAAAEAETPSVPSIVRALEAALASPGC